MTTFHFIRKYDLNKIAEYQQLRFDCFRYAISCENYNEYEQITKNAIKSGVYAGSHIHTRTVFIMDSGKYEAWRNACENETKRLNEWWFRYNSADAETRKLMACGVIV